MKIALAQQNYTIGDFKSNKEKIVRCIEQAKSESADLVVFSEQAISGAPAYDLLNKVTFLELCEETLEEIARCCEGISVLVGMPAQCMNKTISVAALIEDRKIKRYVGKKTIESRDEMCHISSSKGCEYIKIRGKKIAVVVGEDIKTEQEYGEYADLIVNLAHSPYSRGVVEKRYDFYRQMAFMTGKTILYVNSVGGQTDIVYDGSSAAFNSRGEAIALLKSFEEDFQTVDVDGNETPKKIPEQNKTYNVYRAIKLGLGDFFVKNGFKTACLGLSGGIDSAVVLSMAAETLGPENIRVLLMPSQFSSDHSVEGRARAGGKSGRRIPDRSDQRDVRRAYGNARSGLRRTAFQCSRGKYAGAHPGHDDDGHIEQVRQRSARHLQQERDSGRLRHALRRYGRRAEHHRRPV